MLYRVKLIADSYVRNYIDKTYLIAGNSHWDNQQPSSEMRRFNDYRNHTERWKKVE